MQQPPKKRNMAVEESLKYTVDYWVGDDDEVVVIGREEIIMSRVVSGP